MNPLRILATLAIGASLLVGCSSGDAPAGPGDDNAVKNALPKMSREEKIKFYQNSPLPAAEKAAKLKELGAEPAAPSTPGTPVGAPGR